MKAKYFRVGDFIEIDNSIFQIIKITHTHRGRGKADLEFQLKNIKTNSVTNKVFNPDEEINEADLEKRKIYFLYMKNDKAYFLDDEKKKFELSIEEIGSKYKFLKKDLDLYGLFYEDKLIGIQFPIKAVYEVISAPPGIKGDSEKSNYKIVTIDTGAEIAVPLFINVKDKIVINLEKEEYVERAKE